VRSTDVAKLSGDSVKQTVLAPPPDSGFLGDAWFALVECPTCGGPVSAFMRLRQHYGRYELGVSTVQRVGLLALLGAVVVRTRVRRAGARIDHVPSRVA